jgi:hypothetical protein
MRVCSATALILLIVAILLGVGVFALVIIVFVCVRRVNTYVCTHSYVFTTLVPHSVYTIFYTTVCSRRVTVTKAPPRRHKSVSSDRPASWWMQDGATVSHRSSMHDHTSSVH